MVLMKYRVKVRTGLIRLCMDKATCEHDNEHSDSVRRVEFLDWLNEHNYLFQKGFFHEVSILLAV